MEYSLLFIPLETCLTVNGVWGYDITDKRYKSDDELISNLVRAAGKNANLLLNIGPRPDGQLPVEAIQHLQGMGEWLSKYGETIYGTRNGLIAPHPWGVSTQKGDLHQDSRGHHSPTPSTTPSV